MSPQHSLMIASIFFAVYWTIAMILINAPDVVGAVVLTIAGGLVGVLWYFAMRWWIGLVGVLWCFATRWWMKKLPNGRQ